jgi:hypothetical protein
MAGDIHYIYIMDNKKSDNEKIIEQFYLGKMRYMCSEFSLEKYKYFDDSASIRNNLKGKYYILTRKPYGRETYSVMNLNTIDKIRNILKGEPINKDEQEAYDETLQFINFVDENLKSIKENNYDVVFYTSHDG